MARNWLGESSLGARQSTDTRFFLPMLPMRLWPQEQSVQSLGGSTPPPPGPGCSRRSFTHRLTERIASYLKSSENLVLISGGFLHWLFYRIMLLNIFVTLQTFLALRLLSSIVLIPLLCFSSTFLWLPSGIKFHKIALIKNVLVILPCFFPHSFHYCIGSWLMEKQSFRKKSCSYILAKWFLFWMLWVLLFIHNWTPRQAAHVFDALGKCL